MSENETLDWVRETLEQRLKELRAKYGKESSPLLFRGQGNSEWPLTTTLERSGARDMLFSEYYCLICAGIAPEVKTFAGVDVPEHIPSVDTFQDRELLSFHKFPPVDLYRYMAYLRHFGFPITTARLVAITDQTEEN